ncbi:MAG: type-F conjugative transfer system protein TraW [Sulfuritalea sp.]|nr:type-F conjugative transfer system protein TraW [Sulfuritalea sp.]
MRYAFLVTLPCLLLNPGFTLANDLGVVGPTYEIAERDLIEVMKDKFRRMEKSGELARLQESYKQRVIETVEKPKPVHGVSTTETARTFYVDPTWTLDRNVVDEQGKLLFPAGTKVNPLDYAPLTQYLLFFDQREKAQVAFARRFIEQSKARVKPILVGGEPLKLMRQWKREVFYDQGGVLSRKFLLKHSPAIVSQEGKRLRIDEIHP